MKNTKNIISSAILAVALTAGCTTPMLTYEEEVSKLKVQHPKYLQLIIKESKQDSDICFSLEENKIIQMEDPLIEMLMYGLSHEALRHTGRAYKLSVYNAQGEPIYRCMVPSALENMWVIKKPLDLSKIISVDIPYDARMNKITIEHKGKCTDLLTINQLPK